MDDSDDPGLRKRRRELIQRYLLGGLESDEVGELEAMLTRSRAARDDFRRGCNIDTALRQASARLSHAPDATPASREPEPASRTGWLQTWFTRRSLSSLTAGLVIGICCASAVWAMSASPFVATVQQITAVGDRGFGDQVGRIPRGFPAQVGVWSGDEAEVVASRNIGGTTSPHVLQFLKPGSDDNDPNGRAVACDVFQLVDLRQARQGIRGEDEVTLDLTARFLDARPQNSSPTVTFIAKVYLFAGDPTTLHREWPQANLEALASGVGEVTTDGGVMPEWKTVSAKSLIPPNADFAVVQLAARPNLRPSAPPSLYADGVRLTVRVNPPLPVRVVQK
ncbi:MAG: hypothetical protein U0792_01105 [Gemmataceae bacterium]